MDDFDLVEDANEPLTARVRTVAEGEHRRNRTEILIENEPNILGAVGAGVELLQLFAAPRLASSQLVHDLSGSVPTSVITDDALSQLFQKTRVPQIFALARLPKKRRYRDFAETTGDVVVLDSVEGPGNLGSIIRIATAFDAAGLIALDQHHSDIYRRGVVRASAGTMFALPIVTGTTESFIRFCEASDTRIVTTSSHGADTSFDEVMSSEDRLAIVLGSEARGCRPELERVAAMRCRIPMNPAVESLNVSSAASVLLFSRRHARGDG